MKQRLNVILILLFFTSAILNAQQLSSTVGMCDTSRNKFLKSNIRLINNLNKSSKMVFLLYEGDSYYRPGYSFAIWESNNKKNHKIIIDKADDLTTVRKLPNDSLVQRLNFDLIMSEASSIQSVKSDTNAPVSHNHLIYLSLFRNKKHHSLSFCEDHLLDFKSFDNTAYIKDLLDLLRKYVNN